MATTTHDIRILTRTRHVAAAAAAFRTAMVGLPLPAFDDAHVAALAEPGRTLGAFDGRQVIGGAGSYTSWLTVPGGARVPHAAVTQVGVLPTHTSGWRGTWPRWTWSTPSGYPAARWTTRCRSSSPTRAPSG